MGQNKMKHQIRILINLLILDLIIFNVSSLTLNTFYTTIYKLIIFDKTVPKSKIKSLNQSNIKSICKKSSNQKQIASMQHQTPPYLIAQQHQVIKCIHCDLYYGNKGKVQFYYCCWPFKITKIVCENHRAIARCEECDTQNASLDIDLSKLDKWFLYTDKNTETKVKIRSAVIQCWICHRSFKFNSLTYLHQKCQQRYCHPCLYMVYSKQLKMFSSQDENLKKTYNMIMVCCNQEGERISKYEQFFRSNICVFGGCSAGFKSSMIKIKNQISYCLNCRNNVLDEQNIPESVWFLTEQIIQIQPKNCIYCQREILSSEIWSDEQILSFNAQLCLACYRKFRHTYDEALSKVRNFKPPLTDINKRQCSVKQCRQQIEFIENKKTLGKTFNEPSLRLIYWKDGNDYCGGCLYNKYEEIRKDFQKRNKFNVQVASSISKWDIDAFEAIKQAYQNHFISQCMVCSKNEATPNQFYKVKQGKKQNKLDCIYCIQCFYSISKNSTKYKQLLKVKNELIQRDSYFPFLKQVQQDKKQWQLGIFGCIQYVYSSSKIKEQPQVRQITQKAPNENSGYDKIKLKTDFGIIQKKIYQVFPQFDKSGSNTTTTIPQIQGDADKFYSVNLYQEKPFEDLITHQEKPINQSKEVQTAKIRTLTPYKNEEPLNENQKFGQSQDEMIECVYLKTFESIEQMERKMAQQKINKQEDQMKVNFSIYFADALIKSGFIEYFRDKNFTDNIQGEAGQKLQAFLPKQDCKVFSCTNLNGVVYETNQKLTRGPFIYPKNQQKENLDHKNNLSLMLGLMCSDCFIRYLLGLVRQEDIEKKDWDEAIIQNSQMKNKIDEFIE